MTFRKFRDISRRFPEVFGGQVRPLKVGILLDLQAIEPDSASRSCAVAFLRKWTRAEAYVRALAEGGMRYDLDGQPVEEVSAEHRASAAALIASIEAERAAYDQRALLLRRYEAQNVTMQAFATSIGRELSSVQSDIDKAQAERLARRQRRAALIAAFDESGLAFAEYVRVKRVNPKELRKALLKAGRAV